MDLNTLLLTAAKELEDYRDYALAAELRRAAAQLAWIDVNDRLPETPLFVVRNQIDDAAADVDQFEGMWVVRPRGNPSAEHMRAWLARFEVTHWFPLPDPPTE